VIRTALEKGEKGMAKPKFTLTMQDLAKSLGLTYGGFINTLKKYEAETGTKLDFETEGRTKYYSQETLRDLKEFRKGVTKGRKPGFSPAKKEKTAVPINVSPAVAPLGLTDRDRRIIQDLTGSVLELVGVVRELCREIGVTGRLAGSS
jgi:hypothetical protein